MTMTAEQLGDASEFHMQKFGYYYDPGILIPAEHMRLVEDMDQISSQANIPRTYIYRYRASEYCGQDEIEWVTKIRTLRNQGLAGMCYTGEVVNIEDRMLAIGGVLIRNFVDARIIFTRAARKIAAWQYCDILFGE